MNVTPSVEAVLFPSGLKTTQGSPRTYSSATSMTGIGAGAGARGYKGVMSRP